MFPIKIEGPLDLGAAQVLICNVFDEEGELYNPPDGKLWFQRWMGGDQWGYDQYQVVGYDKGTGINHFAPLQNEDQKSKYRVCLEIGRVPVTEWGICDLGLPIQQGDEAERSSGFVHKSFIATITVGEVVPELEPATCSRCEQLDAAIDELIMTWDNLSDELELKIDKLLEI